MDKLYRTILARSKCLLTVDYIIPKLLLVQKNMTKEDIARNMVNPLSHELLTKKAEFLNFADHSYDSTKIQARVWAFTEAEIVKALDMAYNAGLDSRPLNDDQGEKYGAL